MDILFAKDLDEGVRDLIRSARFGHHFAQHRAQRHDDGDVPERSSHPASKE